MIKILGIVLVVGGMISLVLGVFGIFGSLNVVYKIIVLETIILCF